MSPYYPPMGGGGGSGTPGGSDSQVQVNSQNTFSGFSNLRWIGSSNSLDLNTAGRIRHGGVAEVDGIAPTGVTGLIWLDTSSSSFNSNSAGLAGTGPYYILQSGNSTLPNSQVLTAGSSIIVRTSGGNVYIDAQTGGGSSGGSQYKDFTYYNQVGSGPGINFDRSLVAQAFNCTAPTTFTPSGVDQVQFVPLVITRSVLVDRVRCAVTVTGVGALLRLGVYTNSSDTILYPFNSVSTSSILTVISAGLYEYNLVQTLSQNTLYWLAMHIGTATCTHRALAIAGTYPVYGMDSGLAAAFGQFMRINNVTFGNGLPITAPTGGTLLSNSVVPALAVRLSM